MKLRIGQININRFLMTTKMNENIDSENIERVHNWKEIYEKIERYTNRELQLK